MAQDELAADEETAPEAEASVEESTAEEGADEEAAPAVAEAGSAELASEGGAMDGGRFRFGISGGPGVLLVDPVSLVYGGIDLRLGYQIDDLIAVYAQPQLGFYGGTFGGVTGIGGIVGATAVVDVTLEDRFFVGGGAGFGVLNNPSGPAIHLRGGFYPLMSRSTEKARRKGLMLGVDLRVYFTDGGTGIHPMASIGYEAF